MRKLMGWALISSVFCCVAALSGAADDTIPLKKKTVPSGPTAEKVESNLLAPPKTGRSAPPPAPAPSTVSPKRTAIQPAGPYVAGVDTFGTTRVNETMVRQLLGKDLDAWIEKGLKADPSSVQDEVKLKEKIKAKWGFALAEWSVIQYFEPGDMAIYITLDLVEPADVKRRMTFLPPPTGEFADPGKLIATWNEYEHKAMELIEKGQLEPQAVDCAALHCPFGHKHPNLKKFEKLFVEGVKKHESELADILAKDKRPEFRGAVAYLLAYLKDGRKVVDYLSGRIRDPDELVRNNALRVLGDIAEFHREYVIPIKPILDALAFPRVSDRSKAVYVAYHMASYSQSAREQILKEGVPDLLKMLESKQPDHREFSHGILRRISGKEFAPTDLRSWTAWWDKTAADRGIAKNQ